MQLRCGRSCACVTSARSWSLIKRMRDRLAHHYEGTDYEAVWDTLVVDLPVIRGYLARLVEAA
ncbi:hypothetical protein B5P43_14370 [Bacillus sp. SRB_336]|nr:hypothetical protein B5P43_14370 [Bacillus sp. SRB_336]